MANYHQIKNKAILTPTTTADLGSNAKRYANIYMSGNIAMSNGVRINSTNAITPRVASITYPGSVTATSTTGGDTVTITGSGFSNSGGNPAVIIGTTAAPVVTYISSTSVTFTTPALSAGTYTLYVINTDGGTAIYARGISYSGSPAWTTASGSLGNVNKNSSASFTVAATSDSTVTYSLKTGSLPSGLSLNSSTGAITGTAPSPASLTTYNFTLTATDGENQTTERSFRITVIIALTSVSYLMVAGGGSGGSSPNIGGAGGGAGGLITGTLNITTGTTYTITVGAGGASDNTNGSNTIVSGSGMTTLTAIGGGTSGYYSPYTNATSGGSGGGAAWNGSNMTTYGNALQSTSASGGFGYRGGIADSGSGVYTTGGGGGGADGPGVDVTINTSGGGVGGPGKLITITAAFVGTATTNSTTTLNITAVTTGEIQVGTQVTGTGIPAGAYIKSLGTGTGGTGTYIMDVAATSSGSSVAITSSGRYFAGGGGGTTYTTNLTYFGYGGRGGGGNGGADNRIISSGVLPIAGATNTGGGGGGRGYQQSGGSTLGGSGVVLVSYADSFAVAASTTGSPTLLTSGGLRVYKFTQSGSITF